METEGELFLVKIQAISYTALLDRKKKSRSFFQQGITYQQIVEAVMGEYPHARFLFRVNLNRVTDFPILQYQETDWEFICRLASLFEASVLSDPTEAYPRFYIGKSEDNMVQEIEELPLEFTRDLKSCMEGYYQSLSTLSIRKIKNPQDSFWM